MQNFKLLKFRAHFTLFLIIFLQMTSGRVRSSKSVPPGRPSLNWDNYLLQPSFANDNVKTVVAAAGNTAYIHCKVNHLADRAVTWIRKVDVQVLTVNTFTYTSDPRISAYSSSSGDEWVLKIVGARLDDTGGYECQVSTDPKMSMTFYLHVVVAYAEIEGQREVYMNSGGTLDLTCGVPRITKAPDFILWYNGTKIINYIYRPRVKVITSRKDKSSRLVVKTTKATDSGNYTCVPSNAKPASVMVHILQEETPAAMQHGHSSAASSMVLPTWTLLTAIFSTLISHIIYMKSTKDRALSLPCLCNDRYLPLINSFDAAKNKHHRNPITNIPSR